MGVAFLLFKVIDEIAIKFGIEVSLRRALKANSFCLSIHWLVSLFFQVLKSGVYTDKSVPVDGDDDFDPDEFVDLRTWFI